MTSVATPLSPSLLLSSDNSDKFVFLWTKVPKTEATDDERPLKTKKSEQKRREKGENANYHALTTSVRSVSFNTDIELNSAASDLSVHVPLDRDSENSDFRRDKGAKNAVK